MNSLALAALVSVSALASVPKAGEPLDFRLPRLSGGDEVALSSLRGKPVVVDFWASWCEPCKASMPEHERLAREHGDKVTLLAVNLDEDEAAARRFVEKNRLSLTVLRDAKGQVAEAFDVKAMPYAVVLDGEGRVKARIAGEPYPALREAVGKLLAAAPAAPAVPAKPLDSGCAGAVQQETKAMGSNLLLKVCPRREGDEGQAEAREAMAKAAREVARLELLWTNWQPDSEVSRINAAAGKSAVSVSDETFEVVRRAKEGSQRSRGLFDITFAPLGELWKFDHPPQSHEPVRLDRVPAPDELRARRALVDWKGIVLDPKKKAVKLARTGMKLHLGGIGKGAAVDRVVALLRGLGFQNFVVQAGGDLYCAGKNGQRSWRVGVAHPREKGKILGQLEVTDAAFSTSGDYERFTIIDGVRYHHIIDLRTGYPASESQSATVLAPSATDAEILTKTAFIRGGEQALEELEAAGAKGVLVDPSGRVLVSRGLSWVPQ